MSPIVAVIVIGLAVLIYFIPGLVAASAITLAPPPFTYSIFSSDGHFSAGLLHLFGHAQDNLQEKRRPTPNPISP